MTHLFENYGRLPIAFAKGQGTKLYDTEGKAYLDFGSGLAVTNLGHAHPKVTAALQAQAETLLHTSNLFQIPLQEQVAAKLAALSGLDRAFFCNSGAEANEAAIKLARKYSKSVHGAHKGEILTLEGCFHGRTLATVTATATPKYHEGFAPLMPGFRYVPKDLEQIAATISDATCAIMVEPVQGEGGVMPLPTEFLQGLRKLCDEKGLLLLFDEVQTGIGRTGTMFAFEQAGVLPDIVSLAKALANGVPVGAILTKEEIAAVFTPGSHASTFGGNPLTMSAALATLTAIEEEGLLANAKAMSESLMGHLQAFVEQYDFLQEARGLGLMFGVAVAPDIQVGTIVQACLDKGLLVLSAGGNTLRLLPPLIITNDDVDAAMKTLGEVLENVKNQSVAAV